MNLALQDWVTLYGEGKFPQPEDVSNGWRIEFPREGAVSYIVTKERNINRGVSRLICSYQIAATPNAKWRALGRLRNEGLEPNFRPILLANMAGASGRWWHGRGITLQRDSGTVYWDLSPDEWTNVFGHRADTHEDIHAFHVAIRRARFGLTFGGGNAYGHGVTMAQGRASLRVTKFQFV